MSQLGVSQERVASGALFPKALGEDPPGLKVPQSTSEAAAPQPVPWQPHNLREGAHSPSASRCTFPDGAL